MSNEHPHLLVSIHFVLQMERRVDITDVDEPTEVEYSYSVEWTKDDLEWKDRLSRYTGGRSFVPTNFEIHWLSIINSFVLVLLLTAFLTIIMLRVLRKTSVLIYDDANETWTLVAIPGAQARLNLGDVYYFLSAAEAKRVLNEGWGNPPDALGNVLGMVMPKGKTFTDETWAAVVQYDDTGHIDDKDAASED